MGNFYVNFTVRSDDPLRIASTLKQARRKAFVTPPVNGQVVVYEEESDNQDTRAIEEVGRLLSGELKAAVLAVLNHDDDVLCYWLFEDGQLSDSYNSRPDYFGEVEPDGAGTGGDARRLCAAFSAESATDRVQAVLAGKDYGFALFRHSELVKLLGLPDYGVGCGFRYVSMNEPPEGLDLDDLICVE